MLTLRVTSFDDKRVPDLTPEDYVNLVGLVVHDLPQTRYGFVAVMKRCIQRRGREPDDVGAAKIGDNRRRPQGFAYFRVPQS